MSIRRQLDVYLHGHLAGLLEDGGGGEMRFTYHPDQLSQRIPLSLILRRPEEEGAHVRNWFANLLPEGSARQLACDQAGLTLHDDFGLLAALGRDCAGAVTLLPHGEQATTADLNGDEPLTDEAIEAWVASPRRVPSPGSALPRLSLAGAQYKTAILAFDDGTLARPTDGSPSTHILKIANPEFPELVTVEALGMRLAKAIGLLVANVRVLSTPTPSLLVERYDRRFERSLPIRIHQEDLCQALGVAPEHKYQDHGGPTVRQAFALLRHAGSSPRRLQHLLDLVLFNVVIGNADAHGKNYSLLLHDDGQVELAPAYDLVPTAAYADISRKLAMTIGGANHLDHITMDNWDALAKEIGIARRLVRDSVAATADRVITHLPAVVDQLLPEGATSVVLRRIADMIMGRAGALREGKPMPEFAPFLRAAAAATAAWDR